MGEGNKQTPWWQEPGWVDASNSVVAQSNPRQSQQGWSGPAMNNPYQYFDALSRYQQSVRPQAPAFQNGMMAYGMNTAQNLGSNVMQGFAAANALNSANLQARMNAEAPLMQEKIRQEGMNQRMTAMAPMMQALLGGGTPAGSASMTTNYGAGFGPSQEPTRISNEAIQAIQSGVRNGNAQRGMFRTAAMRPLPTNYRQR